MNWQDKETIKWFVERVEPPGEKDRLKTSGKVRFDGGFDYEESLALAYSLGKEGEPLLAELERRFAARQEKPRELALA